MHPSHVKSKEQPMNPRTMKDFYDNPALQRRLFDKARCQRAAAIRAGFAWLRERLTPEQNPSQWIGRLG